MDEIILARVRGAFPAALTEDVAAVVACLQEAEHPPLASDIGPVVVAGEPLRIPARVYWPAPVSFSPDSTEDAQGAVAACLFTRHHDGRVRQRACVAALSSSRSFVPPFVIQLLGEYVVEIIETVRASPGVLQRPTYRRFAQENPNFMKLTRARATSYWNYYHRHRWPKKSDYPGIVLLDLLAARN